MVDAATPFPHRRNRDGSFDSICLICFATVAHTRTEAELIELDAAHVCNTYSLATRGQFCRAESKSQAASPRR
jgi:hypothetical protein